MTNIQTKILGEAEYESWDLFAESAPSGGVFSTAKYLDILSSHVGGSFCITGLERDCQLVGGIASYEVSSRWGKVVRPRTLLPYNGFITKQSESVYPSRRESTERAYHKCLADQIEKRRFLQTTIRCRGPFIDARVFLSRGWLALPTYTYIVPLSDLNQQWSLIDRNLKRLIRRSGSKGYTVSDDADFDNFYRHHFDAHKRKGFPLYLSETSFRSLFEALYMHGLAKIFHVRDQTGTSLAAQLTITGLNPTCHIVTAGSDTRYDRDGVNPFLRWKSFEYLKGFGYHDVDLTDATLNSVSSFKSKLGAKLELSLALTSSGGSYISRLGNQFESRLRNALGYRNRVKSKSPAQTTSDAS